MDSTAELRALLKAQEKELGPNHVKVANTLAAIADLLRHQGRLQEAEPLYWRVIEIRHKIAGQSNLDVAATLEDLSVLYEAEGNGAEAERLLRWACDIRKKICGPKSEEFNAALNRLRRLSGDINLQDFTADGDFTPPSSVPQPREDFGWAALFDRGVELQEQEQLLAAEELFRCLLSVATHFAPLSVNHARALDHMARTYLFQAKFVESRIHFEQALAIFENTVGFEDIDTVECLEGMADAHASLDEPEQAQFLYSWALNVAQKRNFSEPIERISSKLATLPYVSKRPAQISSTKKSSVVVKKPAVAAPNGGGLKSLLDGLGTTPAKKSMTLMKPAADGMNRIESLPEHPVATRGDGVSGTQLPTAISPAPGSAGSGPSANAGIRKATGYAAKPALVAGEAVHKDTMAAIAAGTLDALLKEVGPRRKKTTAAILKPVLNQPAQPSQAPPVHNQPSPMVAPALEVSASSASNRAGQTAPLPSASTTVGEHGASQDVSAPHALPLSGRSVVEAQADIQQRMPASPAPPSLSIEPTKRTLGVQKHIRKTGTVTKIAVQQVDEPPDFRGQMVVSASGQSAGPPGEISPRATTWPTPGGAGYVPPGERPAAASFLDQVKAKPYKPWKGGDRPPLEELLLGAGANQSVRNKPPEPVQPAKPHQDVAPAPAKQSPPGDAKVDAYMWEKYTTQAERQMQLKNPREAERLYILALEKAERFGGHDKRLWKTQLELARIYEADRKYVRAGHLYRSLVQQVEKYLGPNHPDVVTYLERLGELYTLQDRWDEAEESYQHILRVVRKTGNQMMISDMLGRLGLVQRRRLQR